MHPSRRLAPRWLLPAALALLGAGCSGAPGGDEEAPAGSGDSWSKVVEQEIETVETLLAEQAAAWSRGDLDAFTAIYAEDATFLSASGLTRGRQEILDRYRRRYSDAEAMGQLQLEVVEIQPGSSGPDLLALSVVARWHLSYPETSGSPDAEGLTLLVFHRLPEGWRIVQDASM